MFSKTIMENYLKIQKRVRNNYLIVIKMYKVFLFIISLTFMSCFKDSVLPVHEVNPKISGYIQIHFPDQPILQAVKDKDFSHKSYDIWLTENIYLEFNKKYEIVEIDSENKLPDSVIPEKILLYVAANFPQMYITDWSLEDKRQEVELNNGLSLIFN